MAYMRLTILALGAAALVAASPADDMFKGDSAPTWSARSVMMSQIVTSGAGSDPAGIEIAMARSCDGITGEQMHHEYGKVPRWALTSQLDICSAYDGWAHKFHGAKDPCKALERGLKELDGANGQGVPAEVANAAQALRSTGSTLLDAAHNNKGSCHL